MYSMYFPPKNNKQLDIRWTQGTHDNKENYYDYDGNILLNNNYEIMTLIKPAYKENDNITRRKIIGSSYEDYGS